MDGSIWY